MKKKFLLGAIGLIAISLLFMTWLYPYSLFSINKSYIFTSDPVVADEYNKYLNKFKKSYESDLKALIEDTDGEFNLTVNYTEYILPIFEQEWLVNKEPTKMNIEDLDLMLFELKSIRETVLQLVMNEHNTVEQSQYLVNSINGLLLLEDEIIEIQTGRGQTRAKLNNQFYNLQIGYIDNLQTFKIYYDLSVAK